tara:strand:- start:3071 stop:4717 length:1647 start_codon:yes stop_codon:yes gene_type:complete
VKHTLLIGASILISGLSAKAYEHLPYQFAQCPEEKKIVHPDSTNRIVLSKDCTKAYVLPPKVGNITIHSGVQMRVDKNSCSFITNLRQSLDSKAESLKILDDMAKYYYQKMSDKAREADVLQDQVYSMQEDLIDAENEVSIIQPGKDELITKISELEKKLEDCTQLNLCQMYDLQLGRAKKDLSEVKREIAAAQANAESIRSRILSTQKRIQDNRARIDGYRTEVSTLSANFDDSITSIDSIIESRKTKLGAIMFVAYDLPTAELVNQYKALNRNLDMVFDAMPLQEYKLDYNMNITNTVSGDHQVYIPATNVPDMEFYQSPTAWISPSGEAQIALNEIAACSLMNEDGSVDLAKLMDAKYFNAQFKYRYDVASLAGYSVHYNLKQMYEVIKRSGSSGGFFRKRRWTSIHRNSEYKALVSVDFNSESVKGLSEEMKHQIRTEERNFAIERLFREFMTIANNEGQIPSPSVESSGENGASVAANEIGKCPYWQCQAASGVLKIADAIWGSTKASNHFKDEREFQYDLEVNDQRMFRQTGSSGYKHDIMD